MTVDYKTIAARQKAAIEELYWTLKRGGFGFENPGEAFSPPSDRTEEILALYAANGCALPAAVTEFYRQIGSVNFTGWSSAWGDDEYPDALNVMPLELVVEEFESTYMATPEDRAHFAETYGGYYFPIGPDFLHKHGISGGEPYGFVLPSTDDDPKILGTPWDLRFTEYIDFALSKGGFPGIDFWKLQMG